MRTAGKIVRPAGLLRRVRQARAAGQTIVFTNGCFDILHYGHIRYLETAKGRDRFLVIGLNSDDSVRRIKGPGRPINSQGHRAAVLAALACVDGVCIFDEETPAGLIAQVRPDVLIKGADWKGRTVAGAEGVLSSGGRVEFIKYEAGCSTTGVIRSIQRRQAT